MKPIVKLYKQFLEDLGVTIKDDGLIVPKSAGDKTHYTRLTVRMESPTGKARNTPIYLPTEAQLHRDADGTRVLFHPVCESPLRGNSQILNKIIRLANIRLYECSNGLVDQLLRLAADTDKHANLPMRAMDLVMELPTVSNAVIKQWNALAKRTNGGLHNTCKLRLERDKEINGVTMSRAATVYSPILSDHTLDQVKTKVAQQAIRACIEMVVGETPITGGTTDTTAPGLLSVMEAFNKIMTRFSIISKKLGKHDGSGFTYNGSWYKDIDKLGKWYANDLYIQPEGNVGIGNGDIEAETVNDAIVVDEPPELEPMVLTPEPDNAPAPAHNPAPVSVNHQQHVDDGAFKVPDGYRNHTYTPPAPMGYGQPTPPPQGYPQPPSNVYVDPRTGIPAQPSGGMYYDARTGQMAPRSTPDVPGNPTGYPYTQMPQQGYGQGYGNLPTGNPPVDTSALDGPYRAPNGATYYINKNTGAYVY